MNSKNKVDFRTWIRKLLDDPVLQEKFVTEFKSLNDDDQRRELRKLLRLTASTGDRALVSICKKIAV